MLIEHNVGLFSHLIHEEERTISVNISLIYPSYQLYWEQLYSKESSKSQSTSCGPPIRTKYLVFYDSVCFILCWHILVKNKWRLTRRVCAPKVSAKLKFLHVGKMSKHTHESKTILQKFIVPRAHSWKKHIFQYEKGPSIVYLKLILFSPTS